MRALCVAAHPDDEVLGCGGTLGVLSERGAECHVAILGEGLTSRSGEEVASSALNDLKDDARRAADRLGVAEVHFRDLPDNRFDSVPLLDVVRLVEDLVKSIGPEVIYTHHQGDLNIDHGVVHRAVLTATRPGPSEPVREIFAFEVPSSTDWAFGRLGMFRPNHFVDITPTLAAKIEAMEVYATERRPFPHPRSPEALEATARRWGSVVGCEAAEAFELIRAIR